MAPKRKQITGLRPSALPAARKCPASVPTEAQAVRLYRLSTETANTASQLGTAFHLAMERDAETTLTLEQVEELAREHGVDPFELRWLWSRIAKIGDEKPDRTWIEEQVGLVIPTAHGDIAIMGTLDRASWYEFSGELVVDDWKTGRIAAESGIPAGEHDQLIAYGLGMLEKAKELGVGPVRTLTLRLFPVRLGFDPSVSRFDEGQIEDLSHRLAGLVERIAKESSLPLERRAFTTGEHCRYCRGRVLCPAYREAFAQALTVVQPALVDESKAPRNKDGTVSKRGLAALQKRAIEERVREVVQRDPGRANELRLLARQVEEALSAGLKDEVSFYGPLDCGDGTELRFNSYETHNPLSAADIRWACDWLELPEGTADQILSALEERPRVTRQRFGRYKRQTDEQ